MIQHRQVRIHKNKESQQNISIRTAQTISQYNISDYLPPSHDTIQSRITNANRIREKVITEPVEKLNSVQNQQLKKKIALLQQEKHLLKVELERSKKDLISCQQNLKQKQIDFNETKKKGQEMRNRLNQLSRKKQYRVSFERNTIHVQIFPQHKQSYQVSVQTDPAIQQHSLTKDIRNTHAPTNSDMQQIYQKMQSLKMGRRTTKPEVANLQPTFTSNLKAERPRAFTSNWSSYTKDKQNVMKNSNVFQKKTVQKLDKVRDQALDLYLMPLQQGERLLAAFIDDQYL